ncbi:hypothetical protein V3470_00405 [Flavobacterium oreochromis]|uniref:T9SS C-terminal target domain-containing protein n=1 Tax=Flavobacterium oreochromis TaxID=2906078 RepID=A0ABW8P6Y1_9FLAO|nr:hypothetical protein [Flavobacterium oreochromis]OWP77876.1 hypothetical protein BWG23_03620 [Flavobacterium oreochromis]POR30633.1 hypothetical protein BWK58_01210 [Flavobacterium columnare]QYS85600.1 hypothetical protein JJC03_10300 [Flavobacterium oreochromis]
MSPKLLKTLFFLFTSSFGFSQVGIGTDAPRGALEISSSTNGFLPPQVALTASDTSTPVVNPQGGGVPIAGTIVYNTAISGVAPNNVVPGYYYWNGSNWLLLTSQSSSSPSQWSLTGNAGTSAATNFIGTTDNTDFVTRTNNSERIRVTNAGNVGIGSNTPLGKFQVNNGASAISGISVRALADWDAVSISHDGSTGYINAAGVETGLAFRTNSTASGTYLSNAYTEQMRLLNNGNLGLGTSSPASKLDIATGITTAQTAVNVTGSINDFFQMNVQNTSTGTQAQSGYSATANNGTATTGFAWMGINNSNFNFPSTYNIGGANDVSYIGSGQDMYIANANNTKSIIFSTGIAASPFFSERMRVTNAGNVGIGSNAPSRKLEINSGALATPSIRLTQQKANVAATATTGDGTKVLAVDNNGDVVTKVNEKRYSPSTCSCTGVFPYTLPADLTTYEEYDGNWSGNAQLNTTLPDFILPTVANAIAAGHKYGDVVVIHRGSTYNVVIGTTNTNLASVLNLPATTSVGFALGIDKWYRVF